MFKFLSIILSLFIFCGSSVFADELQNNADQEINIEQNKAVVSIQKQPMNENSLQKQKVKNNWFCIIIQVNGKALPNKTNN